MVVESAATGERTRMLRDTWAALPVEPQTTVGVVVDPVGVDEAPVGPLTLLAVVAAWLVVLLTLVLA